MFQPGKEKMVDWYSPLQLADTAFRSLLSEIFAVYSDKRETYSQSAVPQPQVVVPGNGEVWIDYTADTGDGFNSTYTIPYLMANAHHYGLPHGSGGYPTVSQLLVLGGDEVYPTPSKEGYEQRFKGPFETAFPKSARSAFQPQLYALPGNHDWYDGLNNFLKTFCQHRSVGGWSTVQDRSYFAVKLPFNYWLFAVDIQLEGDIDFQQLRYFENIVQRSDFHEHSQVILCTAEPAWYDCTPGANHARFRRLDYFIRRIVQQDPRMADLKGSLRKDARLALVLTGDVHHHAAYRACFEYREEKGERSEDHEALFMTAGGGGAFLHPTHNLPQQLHYEYPEPERDSGKTVTSRSRWSLQQLQLFPLKAKSRSLVWGNLLFAFKAWKLALLLGVLHAFIYLALDNYSLQLNDHYKPMLSFTLHLAQKSSCFQPLMVLKEYMGNPFAIVLAALFAGIFWVVAKLDKKKPMLMTVLGVSHVALQLFINLALTGVAVHLVLHHLFADDLTRTLSSFFRWSTAATLGAMGAVLSASVMGVYFIIANRWLGVHDNEAFSGLRIQDYKNFLRLRITQQGLQVFVVGVERVARKWKDGKEGSKQVPQNAEDIRASVIATHTYDGQNWSHQPS